MKLSAVLTMLLVFGVVGCGGGGSESTKVGQGSEAAGSPTSEPIYQNTATPEPPPGPLEMTAFTCVREGRFDVRATGRVRNVSSDRLTNMGAQLILISAGGEVRIPYLELGPYTGVTYQASPMAMVQDPDIVAKSAINLDPAALGPGEEAAIAFPALSIAGAHRCTAVFFQCTPDCHEVRATRITAVLQ